MTRRRPQRAAADRREETGHRAGGEAHSIEYRAGMWRFRSGKRWRKAVRLHLHRRSALSDNYVHKPHARMECGREGLQRRSVGSGKGKEAVRDLSVSDLQTKRQMTENLCQQKERSFETNFILMKPAADWAEQPHK